MKNRSLLIICMFLPMFVLSQKVENSSIKSTIEKYKKEQRGPYKDIRWFCNDGTTVAPQERCPEPGIQRARYKDEVIALGKSNHLFLGQILATTDYSQFWDKEYNHSQLKQYSLQKYLFRNDDGWVLRRAQYYRGAFQAEDEEAWGIEFYKWLLNDDSKLDQDYYLIRESIKDIPHQGDDNKTVLIRSLSKELSDSLPSFMNIRIKIHGQPEASDIASVKKYKSDNRNNLTASQTKKLDQLISNMEMVYQPADLNSLNKYQKYLLKDQEPYLSIQALMTNYAYLSSKGKVKALSELLFTIRENRNLIKKSSSRLVLMDLSIKIEEILFLEMGSWNPFTLEDLLIETYYLGMASAGCGYIELWEWEKIKPALIPPTSRDISLEKLNERLDASRRILEWSVGMTRGIYKDVVEQYNGFEPMANGFYDDKIRSSILLYLGENVSELGDFIAKEANLSNKVLDISGQSHIRGINPGYAMGELVVLNDVTEDTEILGDKIYVFNHPPADLKPVAGIATVTEGNMVSHVQLLARNLGIPNAVLSADNLEELKKYNGEIVFYAVSNKGTVIMKSADQMTSVEKALFSSKKRSEERITVPIDRIDLKQNTIIDLRKVNSSQSGIQCGPKAANLGQLKMMFPEHVVEGFVIPFGIFKMHMDQTIPGKKTSYWGFLNAIFEHANKMRSEGKTDEEIDHYTLSELAILKKDIMSMPLLPSFIEDLEKSFTTIFGQNCGSIPVFLRSDTNMEDLKDFTGAGLNLTLFNIKDKKKILDGIKEVWASPYSERSYKWRQRYLLNPENVYPSILVIPSVDVDYSGVLITKGIQNDNDDDLTIAFSRGAGGAVEGQSAEAYLISSNGGNLLLSPSRETEYTTLPTIGGILKKSATFENAILSDPNLIQIKEFSKKIILQMDQLNKTGTSGPHDIELGFKDNKIWLFQIRPFVENKNAKRSEYLKSISPEIPLSNLITLLKKL